MDNKTDIRRGFGLVEVVISAAIISVAMVAILNAYSFFLRSENQSAKLVQGAYLLEETMEVARSWRDDSWSSKISALSTSSTYYLISSASTSPSYLIWTATTTPKTTLNYFYQTITLSDVNRDVVNNNISTTGLLDPDTKKITASVSWKGTNGATTTKTLVTYLTNLYEN